MRLETERFGTLDISSDAIIEITEGLYGFEHARRFCLVDHNPDSPFRWLQSVDSPGLAFVVVNPYDFFANYEVELDDQESEALELRSPQDAVILNLVTLGKSAAETTANLVGPIVLNAKSRKAKQVVLANQVYSTKHPLLPEVPKEPTAAPSG
jgi:flagellar assembly factor FliW